MGDYANSSTHSSSSMEFSVTKISQCWVAPLGSTPSGVFELSAIDSLPALRRSVTMLHVFKHGPRAGVGKVIREALSKALFYYYPLAGRLRISDQNDDLQVVCSGGDDYGAWFVEASADCTLDAVNYFDDATSIPFHKLLPPQENHYHGLDDPLVQIQVTQFGCNGFVVGTITCHSLLDGVGTGRFLQTIGEMAKGANQPSILPEWGRNFLPVRPPLNPNSNPNPNPNPNPDSYQVEFATIDLSLDKINELKHEFHKWIGGTNSCSTFEMVSAVMWRARTRAIKPLTDQPVRLVFYVNCRPLFPQLPKGFYGNCFYPLCVTVPGGTLTSMSVFQVVRLIKEAKAGLPNEFWRWTVRMDNPFERLAPAYTTLIMTEWDGLGFKDVDYGWGKPVNVLGVQESANVTPVVIVSAPSPNPKKGALQLRSWCVQKHHLKPLLQNIDNVIIDKSRRPRL